MTPQIRKCTSIVFLMIFSQANGTELLNLTRPPAKMCLTKNDYGEPCLTQDESNHIVNLIVKEFAPNLQRVGWFLSGKIDWLNPEENATYSIESQNKINLLVFGGAARATEVSREALAVIVCHELGHVYGFLTKTGNSKTYGMEGEADYFATNVCAPLAISKMRTISTAAPIPYAVIKKCQRLNYLKPEICMRTNQAALAASRFRSRILSQKEPSFLTPDQTQVGQTNPDLTSAQCGLDTFFLASLNLGRPRCWYKPE